MELSRDFASLRAQRASRAGSSSYTPLSSEPNEDADTGLTHTENASINGNNIEVVGPQLSASRDVMRHDSVTHRDHGALRARNRVWEDIANKLLPPEQSELMLRPLEKRADEGFIRTYLKGQPLADIEPSAAVLRIGLTFLPGADKPQVARLEQIGMAGGEPDQKDALWRVNTAATLLMHFDVTADLSVVHSYKSDQTTVAVSRARSRLSKDSNRSRLSLPSDSTGSQHSTSLTSRALANLSPSDRNRDLVNIDSSHVIIVIDLRHERWDLESTLIEVDASSMMNLMINYRHLINRGGPDMTFEETRDLLDTMIEDARRLCVRSPVLFRMSTRTKIINSQNTRYGVNHSEMFRTLTTSQGIKEIISLSASYFNSLDPTGTTSTVQKFIKSRFLQMIVLLLSLLNDDDLQDIAPFLQATYKLKAERQHLELLFLKVIPLMSINSKVFLEAMIPAFENWPLSEDYPAIDENQSHIWNIFIQRILKVGYILPGTISDLGREFNSWIVKWPEDGFKDTSVFNNLQFTGSSCKMINDIPPIEFHPESALDELTVILTSGAKYTIGSSDLTKITCLTPGIYTIQEAKDGGRNHDLVVTEIHLNFEIYEAIRKINELVRQINGITAQVRKKWTDKIRRKTNDLTFLNECKGSGRLTKAIAMLNLDTLAVAYKIDGRKITTKDSVRTMMHDIREVDSLIRRIEQKVSDENLSTADRRTLKAHIDGVRSHMAIGDTTRQEVGRSDILSDEPISKVLYPGGVDPDSSTSPWNDYDIWYSDNLLHIEAKKSIINSVTWLSEMIIELTFHDSLTRYFVTPLQNVEESERDDEVRVGDVVLLVGRYLVIAEVAVVDYVGVGGGGGANGYGNGNDDEQLGPRYIMTNYLRITNVEERSSTRRGRNRLKQPDAKTRCTFR